ncbi:hypothetical protein D3C75_1223640 [compost metagenome]
MLDQLAFQGDPLVIRHVFQLRDGYLVLLLRACIGRHGVRGDGHQGQQTYYACFVHFHAPVIGV